HSHDLYNYITFFLNQLQSPISSLFPYTTLFRSPSALANLRLLAHANLGNAGVEPGSRLFDAGGVVGTGLDDVCLVAVTELGNAGAVAMALLPDAGHQVAALLQQPGFVVAALLHDAAQQGVGLLGAYGEVVGAELVDTQVLGAGQGRETAWIQLVAARQVGVVHQVVGRCRAAMKQQSGESGAE